MDDITYLPGINTGEPYSVQTASPVNKISRPQNNIDSGYPAIPYQKRYYSSCKRMLDVLISSLLLFFTLPLFLIIAAIIKLVSPGQVLFKQKRIGLDGRTFTMYKFRSMITNAEQLRAELEAFNMMNGPVFKVKNDPRVTKCGRFLRKTSLDELPQLWNVLRGEMSLVGPRPAIPSEVTRYNHCQLERLRVLPGLTCLWQISGRSKIMDFDRWLRLDLEYVHNCSLGLDIKILLKTIPVVIFGCGAE